MLEAKLKL